MHSGVEAQGTAQHGNRHSLFLPGSNCQTVAKARRAALLIDAKAYFIQLDKALRQARRSIFIIAWDFDAHIKLRPQDGPDAPSLATLLRSLVEERPELEIRILVWSLSAVHAPSAALPLLIGEAWEDHPRIHLHLDTQHPLHAAHHQKIVLIDDSLAFVGGMDLTVARWDTPRHTMDEPLRRCPDGTSYDPVHDLQMAIDGPAARAVAQVVRERWRHGCGEDIPLDAPRDRWPDGLEADFTDVPMAVARTAPPLAGRPAVEESAQLIGDMLRAARRSVYIEAQYFTAKHLRGTLGESLSRPEGPEIVVVSTRTANGVIERFIMGANRERLLRALTRADRYNRLRVFYPVLPDGDDGRHLLVHAKLIIIDDTVLRVGSANLNNRSVGLDTECDVAIEADRPEMRAAITACRDRLLGEHLGVEPALVGAAVRREGSLIRAIDRLNRNARNLHAMTVQRGPIHSFPGTRLLDPQRPFHFMEKLRALWHRRPAHARLERDRKSSDKPNSAAPSTRGSRK